VWFGLFDVVDCASSLTPVIFLLNIAKLFTYPLSVFAGALLSPAFGSRCPDSSTFLLSTTASYYREFTRKPVDLKSNLLELTLHSGNFGGFLSSQMLMQITLQIVNETRQMQ